MAAVWAWIRPELRGRWRTLAALVLLVGLSTGVVLAAVAGARRTDTAYGRFISDSLAADYRLQYSTAEPIDEEVMDRLSRNPDVEEAVRVSFTVASNEETDYTIEVFHSPDPAFLRDIHRPRLIEGRLPRVGADDEVVVSEFLGEELNAGVGDEITLATHSPEQMDEGRFDEEPAGLLLHLDVVGIGRFPEDLSDEKSATAYAGPAYSERVTGRAGGFGPSIELLLREGADAAAVVDQALAGFTFDEPIDLESIAVRSDRVRDATGVLVTGLLLFATCAGVASIVACSQAISRRLAGLSVDQAALVAMGFTRAQRLGGALLMVAAVAVAGAGLGAVVAVAASPLMPIGLARQAESSRGVDVDVAVLAPGVLLAVVAVLAASLLSAWRLTASHRSDAARHRRSAGAATAARAGWSPATVLGITMALEPGRGRTAVPVRPALLGAIAGVTGVVAALTFGASLNALVSTPADYGWNWAISPALFEGEARTLAALPETRDVGRLVFWQTSIEGRPADALAVVAIEGHPALTVLGGRMPATVDEVAIGSKTADELGTRAGDRITVETSDGEELELTVVGEVLFPVLFQNPFNEGVALHPDLIDRFEVSAVENMVDFEPGVSDAEGTAAVGAVMRTALSVYAFPARPDDVANLAQVKQVPIALAGFLVLLALAAVGHALVTSIRRRRRDIGIVRSLGFLRRDVHASVTAQSFTMIVIGLSLGIPLGLVVGRSAWALVAGSLGVASTPTIPTAALAVLVPVALLAAAGLALLPARAATHVSAAESLRAE